MTVRRSNVGKVAPFTNNVTQLSFQNLFGAGEHIFDTDSGSQLFESIDATEHDYYCTLVAPEDASVSSAAVVRWIEVTFDDVGPRNY